MFKSLLRDRFLLMLLVLAVALKLFSLNEAAVERWYSNGIYPFIGSGFRLVTGWIPFPLGDLLYLGAFVYLVVKTWKFLHILKKRQVKEYLSRVVFRKFLRLVLGIYLLFNVLWGLNYNRQGIAHQLGMSVQPYTDEDLIILLNVLQNRVCFYGDGVDSLRRLELDKNRYLFRTGTEAYRRIDDSLSFLRYHHPSIKSSLFTPFGHFFGFTGYYNPFSGEAQLKTSVPPFVKPYIVCHEIAHQLGYAKENEANMVAFLAGRQSSHPEFRYSAYYDMYQYTIRELFRRKPQLGWSYYTTAHEQYRKDRTSLLAYLRGQQNVVEPYMTGFYDQYLKLNNQPGGKATYSEVVAWLIAFQKRYGKEAI